LLGFFQLPIFSLSSTPQSGALTAPVLRAVLCQVAMPLVPPEQPLEVAVIQGPVATEIRQTWASWASLTTRLPAGGSIEQVGGIGYQGAGGWLGAAMVMQCRPDQSCSRCCCRVLDLPDIGVECGPDPHR
jgi:hypothetical protein